MNINLELYDICYMAVGFIISSILFLFYSISPLTSEFRHSIYGLLLFDLVLFVIVGFVCFSKNNKVNLGGQIILFMFPFIKTLLDILKIGKVSYFIVFIFFL